MAPIHKGDWEVFYHEKKAKEEALRSEWEKHGPRELPNRISISSYDQVRTERLLEEEFTEVVQKQKNKAIDFSSDILSELKRKNYEAVAKNCVMFSADTPDRITLTIDDLKSQQTEFSKALAIFDQEHASFNNIYFCEPDPWAGMPAKAELRIGYEGYAIELWWSGPVMPEANGPRYATPQTSNEAQGHWCFYRIITPNAPEPLPRC